jgi:hypothetical protein
MAWAIRGALAMGWWAPLVALGAAGAAVMGVVRLAAWAGSVPGRVRHRVMARYARWKHIRDLERMWER